MNLKGTLPTLILQCLSEGPNHGYLIAKTIKSRSKGVLDFKEGTLYPALHELENKGLLDSYERTEKGRNKRYYKLTQTGRKKLAEERKEWKSVSCAVSLVLEGGAVMGENPPALERWLGTATKNLAEEGKARVRAEIEAHYWDAVEESTRAKKSEGEAHQLALVSLGDPDSARERFEDSYLTQAEVKLIQSFSSSGEPSRVRVSAPLLWLLCIAWAILISGFLFIAYLIPAEVKNMLVLISPKLPIFILFLVGMGLLMKMYIKRLFNRHPPWIALKKMAFGQAGFFLVGWVFLVWFIQWVKDNLDSVLLWQVSFGIQFGILCCFAGNRLVKLSRKVARLKDDLPKLGG